MAKKKDGRGGSHGIFGRMPGRKVWISGFVNAREFNDAKDRLETLRKYYKAGAGRTITKTDVLTYALLASRDNGAQFKVLSSLKG